VLLVKRPPQQQKKRNSPPLPHTPKKKKNQRHKKSKGKTKKQQERHPPHNHSLQTINMENPKGLARSCIIHPALPPHDKAGASPKARHPRPPITRYLTAHTIHFTKRTNRATNAERNTINTDPPFTNGIAQEKMVPIPGTSCIAEMRIRESGQRRGGP